MDKLLKSISYVFHPLIMPLFAAWFYFEISPRYISSEVVYGKLIALGILMFILPILIYFLLKTLGRVSSIHLQTARERIYPLILYGCILLLVLQRIVKPSLSSELYFFFIGVLISNMACLLMALIKFKVSLHMVAVSGVFMFFVALSIHFSVNLNGTIGLMCIVMGAVATSRLHVKAHDYKELLFGVFIGIIPQLILVNYWL
ncbi:hypothetical protein [Tamlana crocina]|uniref:Transmembrane protein n=1 Tax=Tamlana crocina TaxID=393006 RepID=A0ABX1DD79_9FLAO|nr:hypothetical protein [Tamlana crocina]NJX16032.1 hypothetical protein [Tamlana crocina]